MMVVLDMKPENAKFWVGDYEYYNGNVFFNACKCANPDCQNLIQLANPVEVRVKDPKVMQAAQEDKIDAALLDIYEDYGFNDDGEVLCGECY